MENNKKSRAKQNNLKRALIDARQIQKAMIPRKQPESEIYDFYAKIKPFYWVGGDYYDYMHLNGKLGLSIADVSGKGLEAALITFSIHMGVDLLARDNHLDIPGRISRLNNYLHKHTPENVFATLIYGELTSEGFEYCNAGHPMPLFYSKGNVIKLEESNTVLGFRPDVKYNTHFLKMELGDILLLYTDGVIDPIHPEGEKRTEEIKNVLVKYHNENSSKISNEIYNVLSKYKKEDDQTTIVIKRKS